MSDEIRALLEEAARRARQETDDEPEPGMAGDVAWPMQVTIGKGLEGAIATSTQDRLRQRGQGLAGLSRLQRLRSRHPLDL